MANELVTEPVDDATRSWHWDLRDCAGEGARTFDIVFDAEAVEAQGWVDAWADAEAHGRAYGWWDHLNTGSLAVVIVTAIATSNMTHGLVAFACWWLYRAYADHFLSRAAVAKATVRANEAALRQRYVIGDAGLLRLDETAAEFTWWRRYTCSARWPQGICLWTGHNGWLLPTTGLAAEDAQWLADLVTSRLPTQCDDGAVRAPLSAVAEPRWPVPPSGESVITFTAETDWSDRRVWYQLALRLSLRYPSQAIIAAWLLTTGLVLGWPWVVAWAALAAMPVFLIIWQVIRTVAERGPRPGEPARCLWALHDDGLWFRGDDWCAERRWTCYPEAWELRDHFVLLWQGKVPHLVAKRCLTDEQAERLRELLGRHSTFRARRT